MNSTVEPTVTQLEDADSTAKVLAYARAERRAALRAEANLLAAAVAWADQHPVESMDVRGAATPGHEGSLPIAGEGAPLVAEFAIPEFAAAVGTSTGSGHLFVGEAVELT